jgi:fructose-bisphosphate aldolase class II
VEVGVAVVPLKDIVDRALAQRYGVAAINVFNDLTLQGVLQTAVDNRSPVIVQTSVKTVRSIGAHVLMSMWQSMTTGIEVPVSLHLDHCPDRSVITECLHLGWNSVLFDASQLPVAENQRQTIEVVAEARSYGAHVEGEIEAITGVPIALHGGSGLSPEDFTELIGRGCAKVNISTALKIRYMQSNLAFLKDAEARNGWDPPSLFKQVSADVAQLTAEHLRLFGSVGKAW